MSRHAPILLADHAVEIPRAVGEVFAFVSNHENYPRWYPGALTVIALDDLPPGATGKTYEESLALPSGRIAAFIIRTIEVRAPNFLATEGDLSPLFPRMEILLEAKAPLATDVRLKFWSRSRSPVARLFINFLVRRIVNQQTRVGLSRLRAILA